MSLVKSSLKNAVVTVTLVAMVVLAGVVSLLKMPRREDPKITIRLGLVTILYPGATAEQVESQVARKLEPQLFRYAEVKKAKTFTTSRAGMVVANVELEDWVDDPDRFWAILRHDLNELRMRELPSGVRGPFVDSNFGDVVAVLLTVRGERYGSRELTEYLDRIDDALRTFNHALSLNPNFALAHFNAARLYNLRYEQKLALSHAQSATRLDPKNVEAWLLVGDIQRRLRDSDAALAAYTAAARAAPDNLKAVNVVAEMLAEMGRFDEARRGYWRIWQQWPHILKAGLGANLLLPQVYASREHLEIVRREFGEGLGRLHEAAPNFRFPRPEAALSEARWTNFYLAYQGRNDRDLQKLFGGLASRIMAAHHGPVKLAEPLRPGEPVRVGIVCGYFFQHSVWKVGVRGWVTQLDKKRFQVFCYNTSYKQDAETEIAKAHAHRFEQGPRPAEEWRKIIEADRPHVIIYPEIGMNHEASELAALRLAPVQCSYIGHPQTSGYPTIDCFLSGELFEPPDGAAHYSEKLVKLPNIAFHYEPLNLDSVIVSRQELGFRPSATVYWCAQSLFKYLPRHDHVFAEIASAVPTSRFLFIRENDSEVTELFQRRLERAFAAAGLNAEDHCVFLAGMSTERFAAASAQCDVMLDSIGWSGGNTTLEALAQDLPVVTFEGELMRGRVSAGMLRMMGMPETIADTIDDYVALGVRVARDTAWRQELRSRVIRDRRQLYRDRACIVALESFLERAAHGETA